MMTLKWFTPEVELKLCGHGTLVTAHVMKEKGLVNVGEVVTFDTLSGGLSASVFDSIIKLDLFSIMLGLGLDANKKLLEDLGLHEDQVVSFNEFDTAKKISMARKKKNAALNDEYRSVLLESTIKMR